MPSVYVDTLLCSAILRSRADSLRSHFILLDWIAFYSALLNIHRSGVLTPLTWLVPHETAAISAHSVYNTTMHHVTSCKAYEVSTVSNTFFFLNITQRHSLERRKTVHWSHTPIYSCSAKTGTRARARTERGPEIRDGSVPGPWDCAKKRTLKGPTTNPQGHPITPNSEYKTCLSLKIVGYNLW